MHKTFTLINRLFRDLSDAEVADIEKAITSSWTSWDHSFGWDELLRSKRILIVSEAGVGKTYECRAQQERLWNAGEPAFFLELATLARDSFRDMLSNDEETRFDSWLRSQSEVATFFLDSIDELKLTLGTFDQALKRLNKAICGQLGRARIIITTRPVPVDRERIAKHLPLPEPEIAAPTAEAFADMVLAGRKSKQPTENLPKDWRNVGLMPLSREQIREFAVKQGVQNPDELLDDIFHRDAEEFAQRPQDLIALCSDWRETQRVRSHRDQVETNIRVKLKPAFDRNENVRLSQEKAIEGASRLALATILTRKFTLRHSADSDDLAASVAALDVSKILQDWDAEMQAALLERPLFSFASYHRTRFHHRSTTEFLAAKRLETFLNRGVSIKSIKRLLFADTVSGAKTIRPSMHAVTAWLAVSCDSVFEDIIKLSPAVMLDHGDPQSLSPRQRIKALEAYVERYGKGGWRGLRAPRIQVRRFASPELEGSIPGLWNKKIENPEVRELLLEIIAFGKLNGCADIAYKTAIDGALSINERYLAVKALCHLNDPRIAPLTNSIADDETLWPDKMACRAVIALFPSHVSIDNLSRILRRVKEESRSIGNLNYYFPRAIETSKISSEHLDELRKVLSNLILDSLSWEKGSFPRLQTKRSHLLAALIAACRRQALEGVKSQSWVESTLLVTRLSNDQHRDTEALAELQQAIAALPATSRELAFWTEDAVLAALHQPEDALARLSEICFYGGIKLDEKKDSPWVRERLGDSTESLAHREMMLWAEMLFLHRNADHRAHLLSIKEIVSDSPYLLTVIDNRLNARDDSRALQMEAEHAKHADDAKRRAAEAHKSWVEFWEEIAKNPDVVFAPDRADNTAWNLWQAIDRSGGESRASGWNRRFIENQFGRDVADRLRKIMMLAWRKDQPTLRSERPEGEKDTFLVKWQFGLACIAAEAEDDAWVKQLNEQEAKLACRYAPIELNGFPSWLESLSKEYPAIVDQILGEELTLSLQECDGNAHAALLQKISHASLPLARLFVPRIRSWVEAASKLGLNKNNEIFGQNLRKAFEILIKCDDRNNAEFIATIARRRLAKGLETPHGEFWLSALLHLDVDTGVNTLEKGLKEAPATRFGLGVQMFAKIIGREFGGLGVDLRTSRFTPSLLLRLLRLAYQHVRIEDDVFDEEAHWPEIRDEAQTARNVVLSAFLSTSGSEGWEAKLELTKDPLFTHIKDRVIALAQERAAEEADAAILSEKEFCILDTAGEAPITSRDEMFSVMRDKIDDIEDLLLSDTSQRELWATIKDEHLMRRALAHEFRNNSKQLYIVDQESVTADEKETDIRFRSTCSEQQGVIEIKLSDRRSGTDLFDTIRDQLLSKYLAPDDCSAGCLLVTISKERKWDHPKTGKKLAFNELMSFLNEEAEQATKELGGTKRMMVRGLDLRPRLRLERERAITKTPTTRSN